MAKEYPGYPEYVVITLPKQGTKTMNKCFTSLGYKGGLVVYYFYDNTIVFRLNRIVYIQSSFDQKIV